MLTIRFISVTASATTTVTANTTGMSPCDTEVARPLADALQVEHRLGDHSATQQRPRSRPISVTIGVRLARTPEAGRQSIVKSRRKQHEAVMRTNRRWPWP
jgi:hypothetical protein